MAGESIAEGEPRQDAYSADMDRSLAMSSCAILSCRQATRYRWWGVILQERRGLDSIIKAPNSSTLPCPAHGIPAVPSLRVPSVDYKSTSGYRGKVKNSRFLTPVIEDLGVDEAFLDISEIDKPLCTSRKNPGTRPQGDGPHVLDRHRFNKLLAKIASDLQKPDSPMITEKLWAAWCGPCSSKTLGCWTENRGRLKGLGVDTIRRLPDGARSTSKIWRILQRPLPSSRGIDESARNPLEPKSMSRDHLRRRRGRV
jgi:hypothetical protein